jgi:hypothetical protein
MESHPKQNHFAILTSSLLLFSSPSMGWTVHPAQLKLHCVMKTLPSTAYHSCHWSVPSVLRWPCIWPSPMTCTLALQRVLPNRYCPQPYAVLSTRLRLIGAFLVYHHGFCLPRPLPLASFNWTPMAKMACQGSISCLNVCLGKRLATFFFRTLVLISVD